MSQRQFKPRVFAPRNKTAYKRRSIRSFKRFKQASIPKTKLEVKSLDTAVNLLIQSPGTGTNLTTMNLIDNGSAFYNRIGTEVKMKTIHITGAILRENGNTVSSTFDYIRIIVVYDKQTNGAAPTFATMFTDYSSTGATTTDAFSGINLPMKKRFKILMDERVNMPPTGISGASANNTNLQIDTQCLNINRFIKLKGLPTDFSASTHSIGDITTGGLYLVAVGSNIATTDAWTFVGKARLRFWDP